MGNCFGSNGAASSAVSPAPAATAAPASKQQQTLTKIASNWKEDTQKIWQRYWKQLPIHTDIPRLAKHMEIALEDSTALCGPHEGSIPNEKVVCNILVCLAERLDGQTLVDKIKETYSNYISTGDMSQHLLQFLDEVVTENSKMMKVLKGCQQKIIFPGFYSVKAVIDSAFPFKDARGTWRVIVVFGTDKVLVKHRKISTSVANVPESGAEFEFKWELVMTFNADLTEMTDVTMVVIDLKVNPKLPIAKQDEITALFNQHFPPAAKTPSSVSTDV
jgi:hypothetical protein